MSLEMGKLLIEKMKSDVLFREQVMVHEDLDERIAFIRNAGFDVTIEELTSLHEEMLTDEELDMVAAGGSVCVVKVGKSCAIKVTW